MTSSNIDITDEMIFDFAINIRNDNKSENDLWEIFFL